MATESVGHFIEAEEVKQIRWMLLEAICAKHELDQVRASIEGAAASGSSAMAIKEAMMPRPVDLDITEAAEMVQVLSILPAGKEVRDGN